MLEGKLKYILLAILTSFAIFYMVDAIFEFLNMPDVYVSNSTGECESVVNYTDKKSYSCSNLPSKYNHIWVR